MVGTHRLLNPDIRMKDLGLIIVDEEQRFGVEHKEQMKRLRTSVDVLSMSATPIPRTLEMAITGIREMSTITTPPEERHPVLTYVGAYEDRQVIAAVRRELLREGQVFYIHNRVSSIEKAAARIRELVPEARVATAHGQMGEHQLEQVMLDFWEKRFDVLVCTTIVESGLDVSNANTMIIERADTLGLSQLHQLRGRVGRSRERAYAYFLYPPEKPLTETAHERLATLAQHSDLGGGMAIAMKDLEIRGAGNLLGGEQSGHIADVGFDLYVRLVGEAVAEFRGDGGEPELNEVRIELPVDAHLPHDYIPSERLRLEMYKRLAEVRTDEDVDLIDEELVDRYGEPPVEVVSLLLVARFRARARAGRHRRGHHRRAATSGSRRSTCPSRASSGCTGSTRSRSSRRRSSTILVPRPQTAGSDGTARSRGSPCLNGRGRSSTPSSTRRRASEPRTLRSLAGLALVSTVVLTGAAPRPTCNPGVAARVGDETVEREHVATSRPTTARRRSRSSPRPGPAQPLPQRPGRRRPRAALRGRPVAGVVRRHAGRVLRPGRGRPPEARLARQLQRPARSRR